MDSTSPEPSVEKSLKRRAQELKGSAKKIILNRTSKSIELPEAPTEQPDKVEEEKKTPSVGTTTKITALTEKEVSLIFILKK